MRPAPLALLGSITLFAAVACGSDEPTAEDYCAVKCSCQGNCTDPIVQECIAEWAHDHDVAVAKNCDEEFGVWSKCIAEGFGCEGSVYDAGCLAEKNRWRFCTGG